MKKRQAALLLDTLILFIEGEIVRAGSQKELAKQWGISQVYLSDIIHYRREPGKKVLAAMGLKRVSLYVDEGDESIPSLAKDRVIEVKR